MYEFDYDMGQFVTCKLTGFAGIINGLVEWDTGNLQYSIKPKVGDDGKMIESMYIDGDFFSVNGELSLDFEIPEFKFEFKNGQVQHDVAGLDPKGGLVAVSEVALTLHRRRLRRQIEAAAEAGAQRIYVITFDGPDVRALRRMLQTLPTDVQNRVEIRPVRELVAGQKPEVSGGA